MIDKKTKIILMLFLIIIAGTGVYAFKEIKAHYYNLGVQDGEININMMVAQNLQQVGYVLYNFPINETSFIPIKLIPSSQ